VQRVYDVHQASTSPAANYSPAVVVDEILLFACLAAVMHLDSMGRNPIYTRARTGQKSDEIES
jgi:hypothetical protein